MAQDIMGILDAENIKQSSQSAMLTALRDSTARYLLDSM
jgi:hypothetical protein